MEKLSRGSKNTQMQSTAPYSGLSAPHLPGILLLIQRQRDEDSQEASYRWLNEPGLHVASSPGQSIEFSLFDAEVVMYVSDLVKSRFRGW